MFFMENHKIIIPVMENHKIIIPVTLSYLEHGLIINSMN